jgi:hypothetical protein
MPLLKSVAATLTNNDLVAGVIEEIIDRDQMFAQLPFTRVDGKAYVYNREDTSVWDASANVGNGNAASGTVSITTDAYGNRTSNTVEPDFTDVGSNILESGSKMVEITTNLRTLIGDVDVDKFLQSVYSNTNDQRAIQIAQKAKAIARKFRRTLIQGNNTVNALEFSGLARLTTDAYSNANQTFAAATNGATITFSMLDQLLDLVPTGADAIIMRPGTLRAYRALLRSSGLGGLSAESVMIENFGLPVMTHNGVPILINEFIPNNETQGTASGVCTSIYAVRFNEMDGLHGLYGGDSAGIVVEDLGTVQNKDATRTRLKWYCGLALKSTKSLARITGITNL